MERKSAAKFAILLLLTTFIALGLKFQVEFTIQRTFPLAARHEDNIEEKQPEDRSCRTIPEESDPDEVKEREKAYLEYLETAEKFSTQAKRKKLPDLIGIGTEKCGTGAVANIIRQNPMIVLSKPQELHFFNMYGFRGANGYLDMMPEVHDYQMTMEKTPAYLWGRKNLPQRMRDIVPDAKLFLVLCDPVTRTISDFEQEKIVGRLANNSNYDAVMVEGIRRINRAFSHCFDEEIMINYILGATTSNIITHLLTGGLYYFHLKRWFRVYNRTQILIIDFNDLTHSPWEVAKALQDFVGVPRLLIREDFSRNPETGFFQVSPPKVIDINGTKAIVPSRPKCKRSKSKSRTRNGAWDQKARESTLKTVREFYHKYNEKLTKLIGKRFNWQ